MTILGLDMMYHSRYFHFMFCMCDDNNSWKCQHMSAQHPIKRLRVMVDRDEKCVQCNIVLIEIYQVKIKKRKMVRITKFVIPF